MSQPWDDDEDLERMIAMEHDEADHDTDHIPPSPMSESARSASPIWFNPIILSNIASFLSVKDQKSLMLVNHEIFEATVRELYKEIDLNMYMQRDFGLPHYKRSQSYCMAVRTLRGASGEPPDLMTDHLSLFDVFPALRRVQFSADKFLTRTLAVDGPVYTLTSDYFLSFAWNSDDETFSPHAWYRSSLRRIRTAVCFDLHHLDRANDRVMARWDSVLASCVALHLHRCPPYRLEQVRLRLLQRVEPLLTLALTSPLEISDRTFIIMEEIGRLGTTSVLKIGRPLLPNTMVNEYPQSGDSKPTGARPHCVLDYPWFHIAPFTTHITMDTGTHLVCTQCSTSVIGYCPCHDINKPIPDPVRICGDASALRIRHSTISQVELKLGWPHPLDDPDHTFDLAADLDIYAAYLSMITSPVCTFDIQIHISRRNIPKHDASLSKATSSMINRMVERRKHVIYEAEAAGSV